MMTTPPSHTAPAPHDPALMAIEASQLKLMEHSPLIPLVRLSVTLMKDTKTQQEVLQRFVNAGRVHDKYTRNGRELDDMFGIAFLFAAHGLMASKKLMTMAIANNLLGPEYKKWAGRGMIIAQADHDERLDYVTFRGYGAEAKHVIEVEALSRSFTLNTIIANHQGGLIAAQFAALEKPVSLLRRPILAEGIEGGIQSTSWIAGLLASHHEHFKTLRIERTARYIGRIPTIMSRTQATTPRPS